MKKEILFLIILALVIIILSGFLLWPKNDQIVNQNNNLPSIEKGITIFSPKQNELISSPLKITGIINGDGWFGFEGQVGTVTLYDGGDNELEKGILKATTEWTKLPTNFEVTLEFKDSLQGVGLIFRNENPSGDPAMDKIFFLELRSEGYYKGGNNIWGQGIKINDLKFNQIISSPLKITGSIDDGRWTNFKGQAGIVTLLDGQGFLLATVPLKAITDFKKVPMSFKAVLEFNASGNDFGLLNFSSEDGCRDSGCGDPGKTFSLPIKFK